MFQDRLITVLPQATRLTGADLSDGLVSSPGDATNRDCLEEHRPPGVWNLVAFLILLAVIANLSLAFDGGDDCLGYTVIALR